MITNEKEANEKKRKLEVIGGLRKRFGLIEYGELYMLDGYSIFFGEKNHKRGVAERLFGGRKSCQLVIVRRSNRREVVYAILRHIK